MAGGLAAENASELKTDTIPCGLVIPHCFWRGASNFSAQLKL